MAVSFDSRKLEEAILSLSPVEAEWASRITDPDLFYRYLAEHCPAIFVVREVPEYGAEDNDRVLF